MVTGGAVVVVGRIVVAVGGPATAIAEAVAARTAIGQAGTRDIEG
jgi:hypothetical protein